MCKIVLYWIQKPSFTSSILTLLISSIVEKVREHVCIWTMEVTSFMTCEVGVLFQSFDVFSSRKACRWLDSLLFSPSFCRQRKPNIVLALSHRQYLLGIAAAADAARVVRPVCFLSRHFRSRGSAPVHCISLR